MPRPEELPEELPEEPLEELPEEAPEELLEPPPEELLLAVPPLELEEDVDWLPEWPPPQALNSMEQAAIQVMQVPRENLRMNNSRFVVRRPWGGAVLVYWRERLG